ncbi:MAG: histidine kinase N-terminal 7TM domain-containing protein [Pseudohongiellaceae bacterium]
MDILVLPSAIALSVKVAIFIRYRTSLRRENLSLGVFFLAIFLLNLLELLTINRQFSHESMMLLLLAYYCCGVFITYAFINICLEYSGFRWHVKWFRRALNIILALMVVSLIFSRGIISDVEVMAYSMTRVAGDYYWVFTLYTLAGLTLAVALLVRGLFRLDSNLDRQRCLVVLLSSSFPLLATAGIMAFMAMGYAINGPIVLSIAMTIMLGIMVYAEEKSRLFRLLTLVPYTRERKFHNEILSQLTQCIAADQAPLNLKQMMRDFEGRVVEHVLSYYDGNQKRAATALGVSEATVSRRTRGSQR